MTSQTEDEENPTPSVTKFFLFKDPDPGIVQSAWSMGANMAFTHMLLYGLTGRGQMALGFAVLTIPFSAWMSSADSARDYEKWKEMRVLKLRGVPDRFLPYRCKYDWTDYDKKLQQKNLDRWWRKPEE